MIAIPEASYSGCSKTFFNKAAGESKPEAYPSSPTRPRAAKTARFPSEYVEDFDDPRTTLRSFSPTLLCR